MLFAACTMGCASGQIGNGFTIGASIGPGGGAPSVITFSPAAGTYVGTQTVTVTTSIGGDNIFYTLDGSTPTIAATKYTGPITVSSSQTITAISATVGTVSQNENLSSTNWKINTVNGSPCPAGGCPTANAVGTSGGVGSNPAYAWAWSFGAVANFSLSTQALKSTGETQDLKIFSGAADDAATMMAEDKLVEPIGDDTIQANVEVDMYQADATHTIGGQAVLHMFGLQCNQQSAYLQWQVDNEQGSWQNTGITDGCPMSTSTYTEVRFAGHWIIGDTGCGGYGCTYYDTLQINTDCTSAGVCGTIGTVHSITPHTLENYVESWSGVCGNQDQTDLIGPTTTGTQTGGRYLALDNSTCGTAINATASAAYVL
jgi:hypothetical protein